MISLPGPFRRRLISLLAIVLLGALTPAALAQRPSAIRLLPDTTVALVSVGSAPEIAEKFMNTAMGRMSQDPQLKPLIGHLYGSLVEAVAEVHDRIGLSLPELISIPQGEVTVAVVAPEESPPAFVFFLDAGKQIAKARKLVELATAELDKSGATRSQQTVAGTKFIVYDGVGPQRRQIIFLEKDDVIIVASDPKVIEHMLIVWNRGKGKSIADDPDFGAIMRRCRGGPDSRPQMIWYANPIGIMEAIGQENTGVRVAVAVLPALGLDGLVGFGGSLAFDAGQFDSVAHAHLSLRPPRAGVLKMVAFEPGDSQPERWVPEDVASYTTFHWNVQQTYKELAKLYDGFNGDGAFAQLLQRRFLQPTGLDLEKELLPALEGRVTLISWIERPVTLQSQASLLALKVKDTKVFDKAIDKLSSLAQGRFEPQTYSGKTYYQLRFPMPPNLPPEQRPPLPCFGILDDYLLIANRAGLYKKVISTRAAGSHSLADDPEYKLVMGKIGRQSGGDTPAMISYDRPEETFRWLYELVTAERTRRSLSRQAENSRFFRTLDGALRENPLPPFAVLRRYLAPGGAMIVDDESGLHYMGFTLRRETD